MTSIKTSSNEPFTTEPISAEPEPFSDIEVKIHSSKRIEDASLLDFLPLGVTVYLVIKPLTDSGQYYHEGLDSKELSLQYDPSEIEAVDIASLRIDPNEDRETPIQNAVYALTAKGGEGKAMFTMLYSSWFSKSFSFDVRDENYPSSYLFFDEKMRYYDADTLAYPYEEDFMESASTEEEYEGIKRKWNLGTMPKLEGGFFKENDLLTFFLFKESPYSTDINGIYVCYETAVISFAIQRPKSWFYLLDFGYRYSHNGVLLLGVPRKYNFLEWRICYIDIPEADI